MFPSVRYEIFLLLKIPHLKESLENPGGDQKSGSRLGQEWCRQSQDQQRRRRRALALLLLAVAVVWVWLAYRS